MRRLLLFAITVGVGCPVSAQNIQSRSGTRPAAGQENVATVGSPIYEEFRYAVELSATPLEDVSHAFPRSSIRIPAGAAMTPLSSNARLKVCTVELSYYEGDRPTESACLLDDDGDGRFDRAARNGLARAHPLQRPVPYRTLDVPFPDTEGSFRRVITYLGASADTLRLSYREFSNDMARPAFTEEFTFPIERTFPQTVAFRNVRMTILAINGEGLRYRIEQSAPLAPSVESK